MKRRSSIQSKIRSVLWAAALQSGFWLAGATTAGADTHDWNVAGGGSWNTPGSWTPAGPPDATGDVVNILQNLGSNSVITVDGLFTLGVLNIGDTDTNRTYTISNGTGTGLRFDNGASAAEINQVSTSFGDTISATLATLGNLNINNASTTRGLTLSGGLTSYAVSGTQTVTYGGGSITQSGIIGNGTGTVAVAVNAGTVTLSGANTYTGGTTLSGGQINVQNASALGNGTFTVSGGTLANNTGSTINLSNNIAQVWNGNFSYSTSGNRILNMGSGAINLGTAAGTSRTLTVAAGQFTTSGAISNGTTATTLIKAGAGTLNLNNPTSTFSNLTVNGGTVAFASPLASVSNDFYAPTDLGTPFGTGNITLDGGSLVLSIPTGPGSIVGFGELKNNIVLQSDANISPGGGQKRNVLLSGLISGAGKLTLTLGQASVTNQSAGVRLTGANNTYTGGTDLNVTSSQSGATVDFVADSVNSLGGGAGGTGGVVTFVNNGAVANQNASYLILKADQSIAGLHSSTVNTLGATYVTGASSTVASTLTINSTQGGAGDGSVYAGSIGAFLLGRQALGGIEAGAAGYNINIVKNGTGTQVLTGTSAYTGTTTVNGGALIINGDHSAASGDVLVAAGGTLGGVGIIGGATTIANNGTLAPGQSAGLLTFGSSLTLAGADSKVEMEIDGSARGALGGYDALNIGTSILYGGDLIFSIDSSIADGTYDLFSFTTQSGTFDTVLFGGAGPYSGVFTNSGGTWSAIAGGQLFSFEQATGDLTVTVVPEPSSLVLLALGLPLLLRRVRRPN